MDSSISTTITCHSPLRHFSSNAIQVRYERFTNNWFNWWFTWPNTPSWHHSTPVDVESCWTLTINGKSSITCHWMSLWSLTTSPCLKGRCRFLPSSLFIIWIFWRKVTMTRTLQFYVIANTFSKDSEILHRSISKTEGKVSSI